MKYEVGRGAEPVAAGSRFQEKRTGGVQGGGFPRLPSVQQDDSIRGLQIPASRDCKESESLAVRGEPVEPPRRSSPRPDDEIGGVQRGNAPLPGPLSVSPSAAG